MPSPTPRSREDADSIHRVLGRFVHDGLEPAVARPERPMAPERLEALTDQLREIGLLNLSPEPEFGLWDAPDDPVALELTLRSLGTLAEANAGVALHVHQLALAAWFAREGPGHDGVPAALSLLGGHGLGRALWPRWLRGAELPDAAARWLSDYFEPTPSCPLVWQLGPTVQAVWVTRFDAASRTLRFERHMLNDLGAEAHHDSHGLDETRSLVVSRLPPRLDRPGPHAAADPTGRVTYRRALELHGLGLCAISAGAQQRAHEKASEYAELRVQAGVPIVQHPAVQELLGQSRSALSSARAALDGLVAAPLTATSLGASLAVRATVHEAASLGANAALQVFGGLGYMRDTGMEKLVRDQNHLRLLCGTPAQLRRFVTELERRP